MTSTESVPTKTNLNDTADDNTDEGKTVPMSEDFSQPKPPEVNGHDVHFQESEPQSPISDDDVEVGINDDFDDWEELDEEYEVKFTRNPVAFSVCTFQQGVIFAYKSGMGVTRGYLFYIIFCVLYTAYFIACMVYKFGDEGSIRLLVCTILGIIIASRHLLHRGLKFIYHYLLGPDGMSPKMKRYFNRLRFIIRWVLYAALLGYMVYILVDELSDDFDKASGLPGLFFMVFLCLILSARPHMINWHTIIWSIGLQFLFSVFTLRYEFGRKAVKYAQDRINEFFDNAENAFVTSFGSNYANMGLTFNALPLAFMASAALTVLYFLGAMQFLINVLGRTFRFIMDTDFVESLSVSGGIFIDGPLAILALRPYLNSQSKSQLFTIILSTISSLGGTTVAIFAGLQIPLRHILASMLISAPATFTVGKLLLPERKYKGRKNRHLDIKVHDDINYANILDAFQIGAIVALPLVGNVIAIVFSFLCGIDWISSTLEWFGDRIGEHNLTLDHAFSYIMYPIALGMGIPRSDCLEAGRIIGIKLFSSSIIAFFEMQKLVGNRIAHDNFVQSPVNGNITHRDGGIWLGNHTFLDRGYISERTEVILTYGLSGLSSFLSVSITFASLYAFLPKRREWLARVAPVAAIGGNLANFMTGCFASIFFKKLE